MLVFGWTLKLLWAQNLRIYIWEFASHRDPLKLCICLYCAVYLPMKGLLQHCLCVCCFWNLIKFPIERFIIFSRQRRENYKPINPHVWYSSPFLPLCLLPSLFYVSRLLFTQFSSDPPCLWCWEVICLYVIAVLSPRLSCLAPPSPLSSSSSFRYVRICDLASWCLLYLCLAFLFSLRTFTFMYVSTGLSDYTHLLLLLCKCHCTVAQHLDNELCWTHEESFKMHLKETRRVPFITALWKQQVKVWVLL